MFTYTSDFVKQGLFCTIVLVSGTNDYFKTIILNTVIYSSSLLMLS